MTGGELEAWKVTVDVWLVKLRRQGKGSGNGLVSTAMQHLELARRYIDELETELRVEQDTACQSPDPDCDCPGCIASYELTLQEAGP